MGKTVGIILGLALLIAGANVAGLVWSGAKDPASDAFSAVTTAPPDLVAGTTDNGYFTLLGFAAGQNADPAKVGYDIWREAENARGHYFYDYSKEGRTDLQIPPDLAQMVQAWKPEDWVTQTGQFDESLKTFQASHGTLLKRYTQWLAMPFDDEGYGHAGSPRVADVWLTHRVYLAAGFGKGIVEGVERLSTDLPTWRLILAHAKTPAVKLIAAAALNDDVRVASAILSRQPDDLTAKRLTELVTPLTDEERSLRWLLRHEFTTGISRFKSIPLTQGPAPRQQAEEHERWLAALAGLGADAFERIEQPFPANPVFLAMAKKQRTLNIYAAYYEALGKAFDTAPINLPKLRDVARQGPHGVLDLLLNPIENVFVSAPEPAWAPFLGYVKEADARLRLASLQVMLRRAPRQQTMAVAIGQAGPDYYDPFTGIPMIWNAAQGAIYSVGRDGRDDGGDPSFDVTVKLDEPPLMPAPKAAKPAKPGKPAPKSSPKPAAKAPAA
jgi:hypothetical protein